MSGCGLHIIAAELFSFDFSLKINLKKIKFTLVSKCKSRQASRQADRQVDRQIDRHTYRQINRQTEKQVGRQKKAHRQTKSRKADKKTNRQTNSDKKSGSYINLTCEYKWLTIILIGSFSAYVTAVKRFRKDV